MPLRLDNPLHEAARERGDQQDDRKRDRPVGNSPAEFTAQVRREVERMKRLVKDRQIELDE